MVELLKIPLDFMESIEYTIYLLSLQDIEPLLSCLQEQEVAVQGFAVNMLLCCSIGTGGGGEVLRI